MEMPGQPSPQPSPQPLPYQHSPKRSPKHSPSQRNSGISSDTGSDAVILSKTDAFKPPPVDNSSLCVTESSGSKKLPSLTNEGKCGIH